VSYTLNAKPIDQLIVPDTQVRVDLYYDPRNPVDASPSSDSGTYGLGVFSEAYYGLS